MSIEIRKVVREILAPMAMVVPCMALLAAAPAFAAAQSADQSATDNGAPTTKLHKITIVAAEKAIATVSETKFVHISPAVSVTTVMNDIPGFNSRALSVGGFLPSDTAFTLDGFDSSQLGTTYDGVPYINTFLGGYYGGGDQHAATPLSPMNISGVHVYSGANTQSESSIDGLGGTIAFLPALPSKDFGVQVGATGGVYASGPYGGGGSEAVESFGINSGAISSLNGLRVLAKYAHTLVHGPQPDVVARINSYYLSAVQPTHAGEARLVAVVNTENSQPPGQGFPAPLLAKYGYDYNYPMNVSYLNQASNNSFIAFSVKSLLSSRVIGNLKVFYNGSNNNRIDWSNPIYNNVYEGYSNDLQSTLKSCSALNAYENYAPAPVPPSAYPNTYNCSVATAMFGSPHAGTAYQHYIQNFHVMGSMGDLTLLFPHNTVKVGALGMVGTMLSEESWYGAWPAPLQSGYNLAWLEHDGQTWMQSYLEDNISLLHGKLHIYPGVKWTQVSMYSNDNQGYYYDFSGSVSERYAFLERSIGVNYAFTPELNVYVNYGRSYKQPNISALYGVIGASQQPGPVVVKPEYVNNVDAGIRYKNPYYFLGAAFYNRAFNNIFSSNYSDVTGITLTENSGNALFRGFTLDGGVILPYHLQLTANVGYTSAKYTENFTNVNGVTITNGTWRPNIPKETANMDLQYQNGPWYASLNGHYTGSQYVEDINTGATTSHQLGGYGIMNLSGAYTWSVNDDMLKSLKIELHVDNLFNRHAVFYSAGLDSQATPNFIWEAYAPPLFAGMTVTASLF